MNNEVTLQLARERLAASVGGEARFASSFSVRTMRDLKARAARELDEAAEAALDMIARVNKAVDAEKLREWYQSTDEELLARYVRFWAAYQAAGARTANWFVTGPANFPVRQNEKRLNTEQRRYAELDAFRKMAPARAIKRAQRVRKSQIGAVGMMDSELADLEQRYQERVARQAMMKAINAIIRKNKLTEQGEGPAKLAELARAANHPIPEKLALAILTPPYGNVRGFESYQLSNNNAEIKRLEGRIAQVKAKLAKAEAVEEGSAENKSRKVGDVELVENFAEDRIQLIFPGKPSPDVRSILKSNGFRWAPSQGAWQRQLTNAARYAAERVTSQLQPLET